MTVEITANITRTVPANNVYRVAIEILDATGIELDVLVYDTETGAYSHVCSVFDLETYPVSQAEAADAGIQFYRTRSASVDYTTIIAATAFETVTRNRLEVLTTAWNSIVTAFSGTEVVVIDSEI